MIDFLISGNSFGFLGGILTTIAFVPQVYKVWLTKKTSDLSLSMLVIFNIGVFFWLLYGIFIYDLALIIANSITLTLALSILFAKLTYK